MKTNIIKIPRWLDRHLHIRDGEMLKTVLPCTVSQCATGAVIMGNLKYPDETSTIEKVLAYRRRINAVLNPLIYKDGEGPTPGADPYFIPRMTCYLTDQITPEEVVRGFDVGAWCAVKLYMADQNGKGGTTGSQHGVRDLIGRYPVFKAMEQKGIPLLGHFEAVEENVDEFDRELISAYRDLIPLLRAFPRLPIVFEHLTDGRVAEFIVKSDGNIQATVTAHHLMLNRNAMFEGGMNPAHYCKPVPKSEMHRRWVREYVTSGNPRFGAGTDSAPHDELAKSRCYGCAAGIFTAPKAVELYTTVFDEDDALEHLGNFLSRNFVGLYGMQVSPEMMTIERVTQRVPQKVGPVQVFNGGNELPWKLVG